MTAYAGVVSSNLTYNIIVQLESKGKGKHKQKHHMDGHASQDFSKGCQIQPCCSRQLSRLLFADCSSVTT